MRKIYRNFITKQEADLYKHNSNEKFFVKSNKNDLVDKVINILKEDFTFTVKEQSYWRIEHEPSGHQWHKDTGSGNGMMWCEIGVSLLLKQGDTGGETFYKDKDGPTISDRELYDLVAHTSDEYHMVTPHTGERIVFLMFI